MHIDRAIVATDSNKEYYQFWPIVARRWRQWGITPTLAVISHKKLDIDESLGDVRYIAPVEGVPTSHQAQIVRLFLAAHFETETCLISDIDMLPLQKKYFTEPIKTIENDKFVVYSADAYLPGNPAYPAYPMCYLLAQGKIFKNIIDGNLDNFDVRVKQWLEHGFGWHTDERVFYQKLKEWETNTKKAIFLRRGFNMSNDPISIQRIDRGNGCAHRDDLIIKGFYIDFHMPRPYSQHNTLIDKIYNETQEVKQ